MGPDRPGSPDELAEGGADENPEALIEEEVQAPTAVHQNALALVDPPHDLAQVLAATDLSALESQLAANSPPPVTPLMPGPLVAPPIPEPPLGSAVPAAQGGVDAANPEAPPTASAPARNRSPTPPRALFRSTTGKGVAFTKEDVSFLVKFLDYRKSVRNSIFSSHLC